MQLSVLLVYSQNLTKTTGMNFYSSVTFGLPLSPAADACRTARHALSLIATARPATFIITMAKEVARFNQVAQNPQSQHSQLGNSVLVRSKTELLRVIELLVEKMPNDIADQIVEVRKFIFFFSVAYMSDAVY